MKHIGITISVTCFVTSITRHDPQTLRVIAK